MLNLFKTFIGGSLFLTFVGCASIKPVTYDKSYDFTKINRVAVLGFESIAEMEESGPSFTMIFEKLLIQAGYQLVERQKIARVIKEQNFQFSGAVDAYQVSEIGKILGADAVVMGHVTVFSPHEKGVVLVEVRSKRTEPVVIQKRVESQKNGKKVVEILDVVTEYKETREVREVPQIYRIQAEAGAVVKMVDAETGAIAWVGTASDEGVNVHTAAEYVGRRIMKSLKKIWPNELAKNP